MSCWVAEQQATQRCCDMAIAASLPPLVVMVEANETGSGIAAALTGNDSVELAQIAIRLDDGTPSPIADIDAETEKCVADAANTGWRALLILVDQSKTGLRHGLAPMLDRRPLIVEPGWDQHPTIFPFLLYSSQSTSRIALNSDQTLQIYRQLPVALDIPHSETGSIRGQLGQPVACGTRNGTAISALRLCLSSGLIADAAASSGQGRSIIDNAINVLDKTALLIDANHK